MFDMYFKNVVSLEEVNKYAYLMYNKLAPFIFKRIKYNTMTVPTGC